MSSDKNRASRSFAIRMALASTTGWCFHTLALPLLGSKYARLFGLGVFCFTLAVAPFNKE